MSSREVNLELMSFVETNILPQYNNLESHHGLSKILNIIKQSLQLAKVTTADINMAYTIAAYHDLGLNGPKAIHHITGGKILSKDARLLNWFSKEQITTMKEAIEDHRASMAHAPRSIYGCIIAESVRDLTLETVFKDTIAAIRLQYPNATKEEVFRYFKKHITAKYSINGYIRLWIPNSNNAKGLSEIRRVIESEVELLNTFNHYFDL